MTERQGARVYSEADLGDNSDFRAFGSRLSARDIKINSGYLSGYQVGFSGTVAIQNKRIDAICC